MNNEETKIPLFRRCVLQNFPFIEQDFDALTDYALLCKVVEYLNKVITATNENSAQVEALTVAFNNLKSYVDHYFDNLDVQEEINNKLDQMAIDGSLTTIIANYVDSYMNETINPIVNNQNNRIAIVEDKVDAVSSFAPIPVASAGDMTDTTKTYVLTTDGKWYYYNGTAWVAGGTYQATSLGNASVSLKNLTNSLASNIYHEQTDVNLLGLTQQNANMTNSWNATSPMLVKAGTTIQFSEDFVSNYHWKIARIGSDTITISGYIVVNYTTNTSYTFTDDELCIIIWEPIDSNWQSTDYTVSKYHYLDNDDVTSIKYYVPNTEYNTLVDLDVNQIKQSMWVTAASAGHFTYGYYRLGTSRPYKSTADIVINVDKVLDYGVIAWDLSDGIDNITMLSDTGWLNNTSYTIPANTYFTLGFKMHDNTIIGTAWDSSIKDLIHLRSYSTINDAKAFADEYASGVSTYNYTGENLDLQFKHGYEISDVMNLSAVTTSSQGFDIYNNQYLVQLYANNTTLQIVDFTTGDQLGVITNVGFDHGDTCQFSNTFYNESDLLPLLYVTSDTTPAKVHVIRITGFSTATIIKTYVLDNNAGYYAGECYDFENKLMYVFGYKQNEFHTNTGGTNNVIVSVYDMSQETLIGGINYSLALVDRWEIPFIYCIQGQKFLNGKCYLVSSYLAEEQHTRIYVYNPITRQMVAEFTNMPAGITSDETEDITFIKGSNKYEMIVGTRQKYMKLSFAN